MVGRAAILACVILLLTVLPANADFPVVRVMVDTGDGWMKWVDVVVPNPPNALRVGLMAAAALNITVVNTTGDIIAMRIEGEAYGDESIGGPYWHLLVWDGGAWTFPDRPAVNVSVGDNSLLAWFYTTDDPLWNEYGPWIGPWPTATPTDRFPVTTRGYDAGNRGGGTEGPQGPLPLKVVWSRATEDSFDVRGQPLLVRDLLIAQGQRSLWAFSASEGDVAWRNSNLGGPGSPVAYNGSLYVASSPGQSSPQVYRLTFGGSPMWNRTLPSPPAGPLRAVQNLVLIPLEDRLLALNASTAYPDWQYLVRDGKPGAMVVIRDMALMTLPSLGTVVALSLRTGGLLWKRYLPRPGEMAYARGRGVLLVSGGAAILVDVGNHTLQSWEGNWDPAARAFYDGHGFVVTLGDLVAYLTTDGIAWSRSEPPASNPTVLVGTDYLAVLRTNGTEGLVEGLDPATGGVSWTRNISFNPAGGLQALLDRGLLYTAGADGMVRELSSVPTGCCPPSYTPPSWTIPIVLGALGVAAGGVAVAVATLRRRRRQP